MLREWLQLIYLKGLSTTAKRELVAATGSPGAALQAGSATVARLAGRHARGRSVPSPAILQPTVDADIACLERIGGSFIGFNDPGFPPLLNQINSAPLGLFVLGDHALLYTPQLAIVGSRNPTAAGNRTTEILAAGLSTTGLTITSGLALGIDSSAHRGCLDAAGKTIAVIATGIDINYPRTNSALSREIAGGGLVVSEYPPGTPPKREYFPQRNRLISGLSLGTLVVEAGMRSGSLITARLAGEQGREVFAVPGSIHVPTSRGCHHLLRQGAKLVETTSDVLEEIGQFFTVQPQGDELKSAPAQPGQLPGLYDLIDYAPISIDRLIERSGLTADQVSFILMDLELRGLIAATIGGYQRLPG